MSSGRSAQRESARSEVDWDPLSGLGSEPGLDEGEEFNPFNSPPPSASEVPMLLENDNIVDPDNNNANLQKSLLSNGSSTNPTLGAPSYSVTAPIGSIPVTSLAAMNHAQQQLPQHISQQQRFASREARTSGVSGDMHFMKPVQRRVAEPQRQNRKATEGRGRGAQGHDPLQAQTIPPTVSNIVEHGSQGNMMTAPTIANVGELGAATNENLSVEEEAELSHKPVGAEKTLVNIDRVAFVSMNQDIVHGKLHVTNYRVYFNPSSQSKNESHNWLFQDDSMFDVPLGCIDKISRGASAQSVSSRGKDGLMLNLVCKDFRKLQFRFASHADASKVHDLVRMSAFPVSEGQGLRWLFALEHGRFVLGKGSEQRGWRLYDPRREFIRQGLFGASGNDENIWRLSEVNQRYQLCASYPSLLGVPSSISDEDLRVVAQFRSKGRIPALSWYNADNKGSIWRSSQPKVGLGNNTCRADEQLWSSILQRANSVAARIVDCRPYKNALGNKAKGMGYEDELRYPHTSVSFQNIQNIHTIRGSMDKLMHLVTSTSASSSSSSSVSSPGHNWLANVENTGWLNHLRAVLNASITVARYVACNGFPVLVHCSDGWDRTSQVCALAQLLLDPYYRTLEGFPVLVEKEWLSFGYRFMSRTGHGMEGGSEERSPCFLQFIDCVWQLLNQYAPCFEFNEAYLICILKHLYSCKYGTFLCDNESERMREAIPLKTVSLWDHLAERKNDFVNILYAPMPNELEEKIPLLPHPAVVARKVVLWDNYYLRYASLPSLHDHAFQYLARAKFRREIQSTAQKLEASLREAYKEKERLQKQIVALRTSITEFSVGDKDEIKKSTSEVGDPPKSSAEDTASDDGSAVSVDVDDIPSGDEL